MLSRMEQFISDLPLLWAGVLASLIAGLLWETQGSRVTFLCGAGFSGLALVGILARVRRRQP